MTVVNNYGAWLDSEIVTVGVVSINNLEWINEEVDCRSIDIGYLEAKAQFLREKIGEWESAQGDNFVDGSAPDEETIEEWGEEFNNFDIDGGEYLIGSWKENEEGKYIPDEEGGEFSAIVAYDSFMIVTVIWSRFATRGALCSPCIPGAVDLDNEGEFLGYDLPMDLYGGSRENTNPQIELPTVPIDGSAPDAQGEPSSHD